MRLRTLFLGVAVLAAVAWLTVWGSLRSYRVFAQEELVAVVRCEDDPKGGRGQFLLELVPIQNGIPGRPENFSMAGDQWAIGGEVLKWHPRAAFLGLKSRYKLTRLHSRYVDPGAERTSPRSVYELGGGPGAGWGWLRRWGALLPGVDAVYGNAAYVEAHRGRQWGVYVSHSGYFIRPMRRAS